MPTLFETVPWYIQDILISDEYEDFLSHVQKEFALSDEQKKILDKKIIFSVLQTKGTELTNLISLIQSKLNLKEDDAKACARRIFLNVVLVFPEFFGNQKDFYRSLGGDPDQDLYQSFTYKFIADQVFDGFLAYLEGALNFDSDQEALDMRELFEREIIDVFYAPDSDIKRRLNNTLILLFGSVQNIHEHLAQSLSQNNQWIGGEKMTLEGKEAEPTAGNWIKDFLSAMNGEVSTISIPKYLSTSPNAKKLQGQDRDVLYKLLETFRVLHTFPRSFENLDPEQWMVIPYKIEEKPITHNPQGDSRFTNEDKLESGIRNQESGEKPQTQNLPTTNYKLQTSKLPTTNYQLQTNNLPTDKVPQSENLQPTTQNLQLTTDNLQLISMDQDFLTQAATLLTQSGIQIDDSSKKENVQKFLAGYLRGLRNELDTKIRLKESPEQNGCGLSEQDTDVIMKKAREVFNKLHKEKISGVEQVQEMNQESGIKNQDKSQSGTREVFGRSRIQESRIRNQESGEKPQTQNLPTTNYKLQTSNLPTTNHKLQTSRVPDNLPVVQDEKPLLVIEDVDGLPTFVQKGVTSNPQPVTGNNTKNGNGKTEAGSRKQESGEKVMKPETQNVKQQDQQLAKGDESGIMNHESGINSKDQNLEPITYNLEPKKIPLTVKVTSQGASSKKGESVSGIRRPQVMDAIEEIRTMKLIDFRRISQNPLEAIKKIHQKIISLEKDSFAKKTAALEAWKDCEVNKIYLQMGAESFGKGIPLKQVIEKWKGSGQEYLSEEEFDSLLELNEMLRF